MDKEFLINLTCEIYRLTLLFPKKEPLRYKIREVADEILAHLLNKPTNEKLTNLFEVLDGFLEVALAQNWVKPVEILAVKEKYGKVRELLKNSQIEVAPQVRNTALLVKNNKTEILPINNKNSSFIERQKKILEFIKENGRAQVWQIKQLFPNISKRTLRRDFEALFRQGLVERIGEKNNTFYQLKFSVNQEVGQLVR